MPSANKLGRPSVTRRSFCLAGAYLAVIPAKSARSQVLTAKITQVKDILADFAQSETLSSENRSFREFAENFPILSYERAPSKIVPSKLRISSDSSELIVAFEVSSSTVYTKKYESPIWPGGRSGITIGVGYDVGYVKYEEMMKDWDLKSFERPSGFLDLKRACSVVVGAKLLEPELKHIKIPWALAKAQFDIEIQKYVALAQRALPNFGVLHEHSRGALASLTYNRGPSFDVPADSDVDGRYREMRQIKALMIQKQFNSIPDQIREMKRLWPDMKGLQRRRDAEAALFEAGLAS